MELGLGFPVRATSRLKLCFVLVINPAVVGEGGVSGVSTARDKIIKNQNYR